MFLQIVSQTYVDVRVVRNRARELVEMLSDVEKIRAERRKAKANKHKYTGTGNDGMSFGSTGGRYGGFEGGSYGNNGGSYSGGGSSSYERGQNDLSNTRMCIVNIDAALEQTMVVAIRVEAAEVSAMKHGEGGLKNITQEMMKHQPPGVDRLPFLIAQGLGMVLLTLLLRGVRLQQQQHQLHLNRKSLRWIYWAGSGMRMSLVAALPKQICLLRIRRCLLYLCHLHPLLLLLLLLTVSTYLSNIHERWD